MWVSVQVVLTLHVLNVFQKVLVSDSILHFPKQFFMPVFAGRKKKSVCQINPDKYYIFRSKNLNFEGFKHYS